MSAETEVDTMAGHGSGQKTGADSLTSKTKKLRKSVDRRIDGYLEGTYDPKAEVKKHGLRGLTTALLVVSLLTGLAFSSPADIVDEQTAANYRPAPVVMDIDDVISAPVDDSEDDADEQKSSRGGFFARFRQAILTMPQSVRVVIVLPLWVVGTALLTAISFLWNVIFASPFGAFIASLAAGFAILTGLFTATAKALFPDIPIRKLLCGRNLIILGITALLLSLIDAAAPLYWHQYPLAAALVKIAAGGTVIGILSVRANRLYHRLVPASLRS